jgi:hypothetical protein
MIEYIADMLNINNGLVKAQSQPVIIMQDNKKFLNNMRIL